MRETDRQNAIQRKVASMAAETAAALPTGFPTLDEATGGLPRGRIVELFGGSDAGKTTVALRVAGHTQAVGGGVAWIDADRAFDAAYAASLGVAVERLPVAQPASAEQAFEIMAQLALSGAVDLIVVDSAAALAPEIELQTGIGESGHGAHSRALASGLRKLASALRRSNAVALFLNQTRGDGEAAGGAPLKIVAAVRIALRRADARQSRFRVLKNKAAEPFREGCIVLREGSERVKSP